MTQVGSTPLLADNGPPSHLRRVATATPTLWSVVADPGRARLGMYGTIAPAQDLDFAALTPSNETTPTPPAPARATTGSPHAETVLYSEGVGGVHSTSSRSSRDAQPLASV